MKMKTKTRGVILLFIVAVIALSGTNLTYRGNANASTIYDKYDKLFYSTINEIFNYENEDSAQIAAEKELLYDITLQPLGLLYTFTVNDNDGYAVIIDTGVPVVTEIVTDGAEPYQTDSDDLKVYVTLGIYWEYDGENFYDCETGLVISEEAYETVKAFAYFGAFELFYSSENVYFQYRSENKYNILSSIPTYYYGLTSGYAAVAATNLVVYYDRTYTNLIPNYDPGSSFLGSYIYKTANATTNALTETLHSDMGTTSAGTTITQFKNGLTKYVKRQGYSIGYTSLMSGSKINFESAKNTVLSNKAIALFLGGFKTTVFTTNDGYDVLTYEYSFSNHVAAGFGCLEVNYTFSNNSSRMDKYIYCSMGVGIYRNGYINISVTQIDEALALNIS